MSDNKTEQKPVIRIEDLHKYFGDNQVLRGINLEVMPGEKVVVLGPSGSGKSTMLRCINALEETTSGKIYVNDVDITSPKTDINKVREHLGMVFQRFNLWPHKTVLENVALAPKLVSGVNKAEAEKKAMEMLKRVGLAEKANAYPASLSGGQQQRVAIARALVNDPAVILADEATGNLDTRTSFEILVLFQRLHAEGRTIIFVTHNPEIAQYSSRNITLRDGHVTADTVNTNILSAAEALARLPKNDD